MIGVGRHKAPAARHIWRIAVLTAAGAIGTVSQAEAALYYWSDSDAGYSRPEPAVPERRQKPRRHQAKKIEAPEKETAKPQGPVIIAISIDQQKLRLYDANGFFAESPISTGMKGHPTPMGVFSVIQKQKLHHSNIYSGAPMPFMQRITWSGIAIHAGVLPGYPASHGCIRMPMAFAVKMWNWTKMGARVVVTPGQLSPAAFSHPLLVAQRVAPQPGAAEPQADTPPAAKSDKASDANPIATPAISAASLELRSTVGHGAGAAPAATSLRDQTHTADAGGDMAARPAVTMTDAAPSGVGAEAVKAGDASQRDVKLEADAAKSAPQSAASEIKPDQVDTSDVASKKPDEAGVAAVQSGADAAKSDVSATGSTTADETAGANKLQAKADDVKSETPKPDAAKAGEKPDEPVKAITGISPGNEKKDQGRLPDADKPAASKPDPATAAAPKRTGQIAVFISRKDSKLYVRQNFAPLFEAPVTIAPSDRPLGTHVFTAQIDRADANVVHWSVVSLPVPRHAERRDEDERAVRRRKIAGAAVEVKASPVPDSPTEALDRLTLPADATARIAEALSTGSSIIVSDQGIAAGETGEGTDFIVSLR
jgi:lipoprotein-anchoring transpeptidase ErfK/SrfK